LLSGMNLFIDFEETRNAWKTLFYFENWEVSNRSKLKRPIHFGKARWTWQTSMLRNWWIVGVTLKLKTDLYFAERRRNPSKIISDYPPRKKSWRKQTILFISVLYLDRKKVNLSSKSWKLWDKEIILRTFVLNI
jgi:hypothetical protein